MLAHYRGSLTEALKRLFPKARLKTTKNPSNPSFSPHSSLYSPLPSLFLLLVPPFLFLVGFWMDVKNHKEFFDTFASKNNLDPLVAKNWYSVLQQDVATAEDV